MLLEKKEPSENNDGTASIMLGKNKPKNVKWSPENELIMVEWCDIAQCYKWLHLKCHRKLSNRHAWFTIPAIALSTISGTASFAQSSLPPDLQVYAPMAIGTINILIGISTTIQQYLKISELNEAHRVSGISWDKFARNIRIELAKDPDERMEAGQFLKICRAEFDRLMETSPSIDTKTIKEFHSAFKGKETAEDRRKFEELQQERFRELRKPDICNIIISSNESRHHWYMDPQRLRNFTQSQFEEEGDNFNISKDNMSIIGSDVLRTSNNEGRSSELFDSKYTEGFRNEDQDWSSKNMRTGALPRMETSNIIYEKTLSDFEKIKQQKQVEMKERNEIEDIMREDTKILNQYVVAFVDAVGRKPLPDEITLNMNKNVDVRVLESYLQSYNSVDLTSV